MDKTLTIILVILVSADLLSTIVMTPVEYTRSSAILDICILVLLAFKYMHTLVHKVVFKILDKLQ